MIFFKNRLFNKSHNAVLFFLMNTILVYGQTNTETKRGSYGSWTEDSKIISFGLGGPNTDPFYYVKLDAASTSTLSDFKSDLVQHAKAEFALTGRFGFVITANRSSLQYKESYIVNNNFGPSKNTIDLNLKVLTVNLRVNYHFVYDKIFDPYIGVGAGIRKIELTTPSSVYKVTAFETRIPFGFEATLGLRILVAGRVGVYFETGIGRSFIQGGLSLNLGRVRRKSKTS
jgi:outer membrane protein W